jgi:alkyl hydroperoxide reductase subunit AhpC
MPKNFIVNLLISCGLPVVGRSISSRSLVGLFTGFLPTTKKRVGKWVALYNSYPPGYTRVFPTHFWQFFPVKKYFSTLSTVPIMSSNNVNEIRKRRNWL